MSKVQSPEPKVVVAAKRFYGLAAAQCGKALPFRNWLVISRRLRLNPGPSPI